ncbi:siderophore-interacting protein [Rhodococcus olei]|uniref:Siderophore-interacting protein n=1 Tax=Rhodococcus olei TaxID=2161675 RepID=A0ABP8NX79_9NOCA
MPSPDEPHLSAEVRAVTALTPSLRRVRFGGPDLAGFATSGDPDERLLIDFGDGHRRSYTVRAWHPHEQTVDVDFAVHAGGAAAEWARAATPGSPVRLSQPKGWFRPPADARTLLLFADLTGLPAAGRIVESLPAGTAAHVVAEVPGAADEQRWSATADVTVTWLHGTGNGSTPSALPDALAARTRNERPDYLWFGGETGASRTIRTHLRRALGWPADRYHVMGYWQAGRERWLARYAEIETQIEELTMRELASGKSLDEVRDAVDDALTRAGL